MLRDLLAEDLFCYPTQLSINDHLRECACWDDGRDYHDSDSESESGLQDRYSEVDVALESFPEHVDPLVRTCPYLHDDESKAGVLREGSIGATLGFLLTLLPDLAVLINTKCSNYAWTGTKGVKAIVQNILQMGYGHGHALKTATPPLAKLKKVVFTRSDEATGGDTYGLEAWAPFWYLPSMRSVHAEYINPSDNWNYSGFESSIEELCLRSPR